MVAVVHKATYINNRLDFLLDIIEELFILDDPISCAVARTLTILGVHRI